MPTGLNYASKQEELCLPSSCTSVWWGDVSDHGPSVQRRRAKRGCRRSRPFPLCSAVSSLSLVLVCDSVANVCLCMHAPCPFLALMKEQKAREAIVSKCPSSLKSVPALIPPCSSWAVTTTACHADRCSLAVPRSGFSSPQVPPDQHMSWWPRHPSATAKDWGTAGRAAGGGKVSHTPKPSAWKILFKWNPLWLKVTAEIYPHSSHIPTGTAMACNRLDPTMPGTLHINERDVPCAPTLWSPLQVWCISSWLLSYLENWGG